VEICHNNDWIIKLAERVISLECLKEINSTATQNVGGFFFLQYYVHYLQYDSIVMVSNFAAIV
jgi:hypothetical protein